jgi:hypothetical protein
VKYDAWCVKGDGKLNNLLPRRYLKAIFDDLKKQKQQSRMMYVALPIKRKVSKQDKAATGKERRADVEKLRRAEGEKAVGSRQWAVGSNQCSVFSNQYSEGGEEGVEKRRS